MSVWQCLPANTAQIQNQLTPSARDPPSIAGNGHVPVTLQRELREGRLTPEASPNITSCHEKGHFMETNVIQSKFLPSLKSTFSPRKGHKCVVTLIVWHNIGAEARRRKSGTPAIYTVCSVLSKKTYCVQVTSRNWII